MHKETIDIIIKEAEAYITRAQENEPVVCKGYNDEMRKVIQLYGTALSQFKAVLDEEIMNEPAIEGFAYSTAKLMHYYARGDMDGQRIILEAGNAEYKRKWEKKKSRERRYIQILMKSTRVTSSMVGKPPEK